MTETTVTEPLVVEETGTKPGYAGQSVPHIHVHLLGGRPLPLPLV